jgi:two-component system response regulator BaeR
MNRHILIVEDEDKIAQLHADYLRVNHYQTSCIDHGDKVIPWLKLNTPDLILLDIMLPGRDGISLCRAIRGFSDVPIIMVTARVDQLDQILGLEIGANDYICKPFSPREVVARIGAMFRLIDSFSKAAQIDDSGLSLNIDRFEARFDSEMLDLTRVEFKLLACLVRPPFQVFSRQQLVDQIYDDYRIITDRTIDTHIKNLRKKLSRAGLESETIQSVYGVGYKWKYSHNLHGSSPVSAQ